MIAKKFNISSQIYQLLLNDMYEFGLNSLSKNDFFSRIIIDTYNFNNTSKRMKNIEDILLDKDNLISDNKIINAIKAISSDLDFKRQLNELSILLSSNNIIDKNSKDNDIYQVFIRGTKATNKQLENIIHEVSNLSSSFVFRSIINDYISYPSYIREKILHNDIYNRLVEFKNSKTICNIETQNGEYNYKFKIHSIIIGSEEKHYYVIGINIDNNKITNFKLTTITNVYTLNTKYEFSIDEYKALEDKLKNGPEWINDEIITCHIKFDDEGINRYHKIPTNRPKGIFVGNVLEVTCSASMLLNYLRQFGKHAVIIEDIKIKKSLKSFYNKGYLAYSEDLNK